MGVSTWRLREAPVQSVLPDNPNFFSLMLKDSNQNNVGFIFADINQSFAVEDQQQLLSKIGQALASSVEVDVVTVMPTISECQYIVFLGEHVSQFANSIDTSASVITDVSLSILQKDVAAKKALWSRLKPFAR